MEKTNKSANVHASFLKEDIDELLLNLLGGRYAPPGFPFPLFLPLPLEGGGIYEGPGRVPPFPFEGVLGGPYVPLGGLTLPFGGEGAIIEGGLPFEGGGK